MNDLQQQIKEALNQYLSTKNKPSDVFQILIHQFGIVKEFHDNVPTWLQQLLDENDRLRTEHAAMKEALEWYGNQENHDGGYARYNDDGELSGFESYVEEDYGQRAQKALSTLSKEEPE